MSQSSTTSSPGAQIPILLLKTKSTPHDGYEEHFSVPLSSKTADVSGDGSRSRGGALSFKPTFVPVLEHKFLEENLDVVRELLVKEEFNAEGGKYGGMIFTSQRAVEAFTRLVAEGPPASSQPQAPSTSSPSTTSTSANSTAWPHLQNLPIYTVGPATSRALHSIPTTPPLAIHGSQTGNGEALANYILEHYPSTHATLPLKQQQPPLLFLVGEQRRDIIPKTLMSPTLSAEKYIRVDELTVYDTGVMSSFPDDFANQLSLTSSVEVRWVVVFSPTGCEAMLRALDMLDDGTGRVKTGERGGGCGNRRVRGGRRTYIATIGPTTRDYLRRNFGFEADVCAERPSPEGVGEGIVRFMNSLEDGIS